ncbi:MAG: V-type ATPase subunit [Clostridia bacterium]|nr:V-type ATPase subunit [Clostridia bacterium]
MALNCVYTTGVIAVKEKSLLKERIFRLAEMTVDEVFRTLLEHGYGGGAETAGSLHEYEALIAYEEKELDAFIREYAPTKSDAAYFLAPRDFHNAKALFKANYLSVDAEKMLAGEGLIPLTTLKKCMETADYSEIEQVNPELASACKEALKLLEEESVSGAAIGLIFDRAAYLHLAKITKFSPVLKSFVRAKADMINIVTAFRMGGRESAFDQYLPLGFLKKEQLSKIVLGDGEKIVSTFSSTPYALFVKACLEAAEKNLPPSEAEKMLASYETEYFSARKYELQRDKPFLYYVLRRRAENSNVRIIFAGKLAGLDEQGIKKRLRAL